MDKKTVLFVDDEENILKTIERQLEFYDYTVFTTTDPENALSLIAAESIAVIVSDQKMPLMQGADLLTQIKLKYPNTVRMIMSGYADFDSLQTAVNSSEIFKFIPKPWDEEKLIKSLEEAFSYHDEMKQNDRKYRALDNAIEGVVITNLENIIESANVSFLLYTGFTTEEILGKNIWDFFNDLNHDQKNELLDEISLYNVWQGETLLTLKNNTKMNGFLSISETIDDKKNHGFRSFSFINIPESKVKEYQPGQLTQNYQDTGLLNRTRFEQELSTLIFSHDEATEVKVVAIYFKNLIGLYNILGKSFEREILAKLSVIIKSSMPSVDLYGCVARNIFAIASVNNSENDIFKTMNDIKKQLNEPLVVNQQSFFLDSFFGISTSTADQKSADKIVEQALLCAQHGLNKKKPEVFYSESIEHETKMELYIESEVYNFINREGYEISYQIKYANNAKTIKGFEAVVNLPHLATRIISQETFTSKARELGLSTHMEKQVLLEAAKHIKGWHKISKEPYFIFVNISLSFLLSAEFIVYFSNILHKSEVAASSWILQIDEEDISKNPRVNKDSFSDVKQLGVKLALNDFGNHIAPLKSITSSAFDIVNINKSLLMDLAVSPEAKDFLRSLINFYNGLGLMVGINGIENDYQLQLAEELRCDFLQGPLLSAQVTTTEVKNLMHENNKRNNDEK